MDTHYFIDYESVGSKGLEGIKKLSNKDYVYIFYTDNAKKTTFDIFAEHGNAFLDVKKVPPGDQSLDKHLLAYLGYLIGKNGNKKTEYVIVTKDKGYNNVKDFLQEQCGEMCLSSIRSTIATVGNVQNEDIKQDVKKITTVSKIDSTKKTKLNQQVQQALSSSEIEYKKEAINEVAKAVTSLYGKENFMNDVHNALRKMYPEDYLDVYADIKPVIKKYASDQSILEDGKDKGLLHNEIQKILSKANAGKDVVAHVPGLVMKHCDDKNALQVIYRLIVKEYGQKKGLDIYNRIKKHIKSG